MVCQLLCSDVANEQNAPNSVTAPCGSFTSFKRASIRFLSRCDSANDSRSSSLSSCHMQDFSDGSFSESFDVFWGKYPIKELVLERSFGSEDDLDFMTPKMLDNGSLNVNVPVEVKKVENTTPVFVPPTNSESEMELELSMDFINDLRIHFTSEQKNLSSRRSLLRTSTRGRGLTYSPGDDYSDARSNLPHPVAEPKEMMTNSLLQESSFILLNEHNVMMNKLCNHDPVSEVLPFLNDQPSLIRQNGEVDPETRVNGNELNAIVRRRLSRSSSCPEFESNSCLDEFEFFDEQTDEEDSDMDTSSLGSFSLDDIFE